MVEDFWDRSANWLVGLAIPIGLLSGLAIIGWQVYGWLRVSVWTPLPVVRVFEGLGLDLTRVYNPSDWHGVARIAQWMLDLPLALCLPMVIIGTAVTWKALVRAR